MWLSIPPAVIICPSPAMTSVDGPMCVSPTKKTGPSIKNWKFSEKKKKLKRLTKKKINAIIEPQCFYNYALVAVFVGCRYSGGLRPSTTSVFLAHMHGLLLYRTTINVNADLLGPSAGLFNEHLLAFHLHAGPWPTTGPGQRSQTGKNQKRC